MKKIPAHPEIWAFGRGIRASAGAGKGKKAFGRRGACTAAFIHKRYPTTNQRGSFCLLCFQPVPIHSSLSNLSGDDYSKPGILTSALVRTLDRHARQQRRTPRAHPSNPSSSARSNAYRDTPQPPANRRCVFGQLNSTHPTSRQNPISHNGCIYHPNLSKLITFIFTCV